MYMYTCNNLYRHMYRYVQYMYMTTTMCSTMYFKRVFV